MVEVVFHQAHFFRRIVDSLKGLVEEITFECDSNGMNLQAMDVSHVSLISIELPESCFDTYKCRDNINLSFSVETLGKVLKSAATNDGLTIRSEKSQEDIEIQLTSPSDDRITKFKLKPIDVETEAVSIPDHTYRAKLTFSSNAFNKLVKSLSEIDDSVVIRCNEGSITFSVASPSLNSSTTFTSGGTAEDPTEEIEIDVSEECKVSYALRYLKVISGSSALANRVTLCFSPHFPLLVEYSMNEGGFVRFYLAPKVEEAESDDDEI